ncbi:MAG: riboflavin synthase, partial [Bacteroidota bacterium]
TEIEGDSFGERVSYSVTAVEETLLKTNLGAWKVGDKVNIERCLKVGARLDGHFVQGHVDTTGKVTAVEDRDGSWNYHFAFDQQHSALLVDKGSICINGVSLTVVESGLGTFSVTIIPYTYEHTNFHQLAVGDAVNLEFDILGKYLLKNQQIGVLL